MIEILNGIFKRELEKLEDEINSFSDETMIWKTSGEIKNSAVNLTLHLCGNLQHFIGAVLGKTEYIRNRDAEFSSKDISRQNLIIEIKKTADSISKSLAVLNEKDLQKIYPQNFLPKEVTAEYFLIHLISHFSYHLGQINYLRRILQSKQSV